MIKKRLFLIAVLLGALCAAPSPITSNPQSLTPIVGSATARGIATDIWISKRTDGKTGTGTPEDAFDGSTQAKFDALMTAYQGVTPLTIHLGPAPASAPFQTNVATKTWFVKTGWKIVGSGMYQTTVQMIGNMAGQNYGHWAFVSDSAVSTDSVIISDLTVDCNSSVLSTTADTGSGSEKNYKADAIALYGSNNTIERVRSINSFGSFANLQESFDISISSPNTITTSGNTIRSCRAESPLGNYGAPFAIFGASGHLQSGSSVHDCKAFGVNNGLNSGFTTGGVNAAWLKNCQVYENYFEDCGSVYYQDTGTAQQIRVFGNTLVRGTLGVGFIANGSGAWTKNEIEISSNNLLIQNRIVGGGVYGVVVGNATSTDVIIAGNIIKYQGDGGGLGSGQAIDAEVLVNANIINNISDYTGAPSTVSGTGVRMTGNRDAARGVVTGLEDNDTAGSGGATSCTGATIGTGSKDRAGFVTATTTGTSTIVVTFSATAPTGWSITASDNTTGNLIRQSAKSTTTATLTGTTVSGDVITYTATPY